MKNHLTQPKKVFSRTIQTRARKDETTINGFAVATYQRECSVMFKQVHMETTLIDGLNQ